MKEITPQEKSNKGLPKPEQLISPVILPEGYHGKILLVSVSNDRIADMVILRSGDQWHSEILRNTEKEIRDLGFTDLQVHELGGAWLRFEPNGSIIIWGSSDVFGACDKELAAIMVRKKFPGKQVIVEP